MEYMLQGQARATCEGTLPVSAKWDERGAQRVTMRAEGQFEIASWDQVPYDAGAEGPKLGQATVRKTFRGQLAGKSTTELLLCGDDQGGIAYTALERVVGNLGGRAGTFLLMHSAI